jgi:ribosome-binding protein aMBF1 (putative translation factor)
MPAGAEPRDLAEREFQSMKQGDTMRVHKYSNVEPPGTIIKRELDARGWSQRDLAFILGQSEQQLNPLLSGKRAITADMARLLGEARKAARPGCSSTRRATRAFSGTRHAPPRLGSRR